MAPILPAQALTNEGVRTKRSTLFDKGSLYKLIGNRVYLGASRPQRRRASWRA
jgi:hypothetical protein